MVVRKVLGAREIFECEECEFGYADEATANACEAYCAAHQSCSLEITAKAIHRPG